MCAEKDLEELSESDLFAEDCCRMVAEHIVANWKMETIDLDSFAVRSSLVRALGLDIFEWKACSQARLSKDAAVRSSIQLLQDLSDPTIE